MKLGRTLATLALTAGLAHAQVICTDTNGQAVSVADVCTAAVAADPVSFCGQANIQTQVCPSFCAQAEQQAQSCPSFCQANVGQFCGSFCQNNTDTFCGDFCLNAAVQNQAQTCPAYCEANQSTVCKTYADQQCATVAQLCKNGTILDIANALGDIKSNCFTANKSTNDTNVTCAQASFDCGASGNSITCPDCPTIPTPQLSCPALQPVCADLRVRRDASGRITRQRCLRYTIAP